MLKMLKKQKGQSMVEYVLILTLIAIGLLLVIPGVTGAIATQFNAIATALAP